MPIPGASAVPAAQGASAPVRVDLAQFARDFPTTPTSALAKRYGVSPTTIARRARELGLRKGREYRAQLLREKRVAGKMEPARGQRSTTGKAGGPGNDSAIRGTSIGAKRSSSVTATSANSADVGARSTSVVSRRTTSDRGQTRPNFASISPTESRSVATVTWHSMASARRKFRSSLALADAAV